MSTLAEGFGTDLLDRLETEVSRHERVVIAFSGGVDSGLLAYVANRALGSERVLCVTASSPSLPREELSLTRSLAQEWSLRHRVVETHELDDAEYVRNGPDRCYHCKRELMDVLKAPAAEESAIVALGVNVDDLSDHRPGQVAARERGAVFPLVDAGLTKAGVRELARQLGLRTWDKPAAACLSSRIPFGTPVTFETLASVEAAESALHALGFRQLRVRHYGDAARIELDLAELAAAVERREDIVAAVRGAGYRYVTLDLEGFRSGNLAVGGRKGGESSRPRR
jgi:pyridinium-3,5-biscarboxylic acid mononucleotide sulfurtransferase